MLTSATVGSIELRSIMEPIRRILGRLSVKNGTSFIQAEYCSPYHGVPIHVSIPYDKLVIAVGSAPNTMGTKGVTENCLFLKEAMDAGRIRARIMDCFEMASFPGQSESEIRKLLNFVVVGGGPAGVEFAGEIHEKEFGRSNIKTLLSSRVTEVKPNKIVVLSKIDKKSYEIPFGICVWATGVGPCKITSKFCDSIPEQKNNRAISTDVFLQVIGVPLKNVYAIGDCSTISQHKLLDHIMEVFKEADADSDDKLTIEELVTLVHNNIPKYPQLRSFTDVLKETFVEFDVNKDGFLQFEEFKHLIEKIDSNLTTLPATAQVANQQGAYLAGAVNSKLSDHVEPFKYKHLGSFAYIGHRNAVADIPGAYTGGGFGVWWAWRSIYLAKQFSFKNKML
eukprot:gene9758-11395_t